MDVLAEMKQKRKSEADRGKKKKRKAVDGPPQQEGRGTTPGKQVLMGSNAKRRMMREGGTPEGLKMAGTVVAER